MYYDLSEIVLNRNGFSFYIEMMNRVLGTMFLRISLIHNVNALVLITKDLIKQHKFVGEITANAFILQVQ